MRNLFSMAFSGRTILMAACFFVVAPSSSFGQGAANVERLSGTISKIDPAKKSMTVTVGKKVLELNRSDFDRAILVRDGKESAFNMDDAKLLKFGVSIEITTTEDKKGNKKRHIKITIGT